MKKIRMFSFCIAMVFCLCGFAQDNPEIAKDSLKPQREINNIEKVLKGKAAGVNILSSNGLNLKPMVLEKKVKYEEPKQPLFVVDGISFISDSVDGNFTDGLSSTSSRFLDLEPNNIESISILKGEEAIGLYGSAGKNGVVLVTSKDPDSVANQNRLKLLKDQTKDNSHKKELNISGVISDCEGKPIESVIIKNINSGKVFNSSLTGEYSILINKNDYLLFKKEGYYSQKFKIVKQKILDIKMKMIPLQFNNSNNLLIKKPVIYLYPTQKTDITFQLDFKGKLLTTFPKYNKEWQVNTYPNGKILDKKSNRYYTSLFWDGEMNFPQEHYDYKSGFEVSKKDLNDFLIEKLEYLGLNTFETNDFVQYWLPILEKNETNFIHFLVNADYDTISINIINPKPKTEIRIFMEFYKLEQKTNLPEQKLNKNIRSGFSLVEWGGADVYDYVKLKL